MSKRHYQPSPRYSAPNTIQSEFERLIAKDGEFHKLIYKNLHDIQRSERSLALARARAEGLLSRTFPKLGNHIPSDFGKRVERIMGEPLKKGASGEQQILDKAKQSMPMALRILRAAIRGSKSVPILRLVANLLDIIKLAGSAPLAVLDKRRYTNLSQYNVVHDCGNPEEMFSTLTSSCTLFPVVNFMARSDTLQTNVSTWFAAGHDGFDRPQAYLAKAYTLKSSPKNPGAFLRLPALGAGFFDYPQSQKRPGANNAKKRMTAGLILSANQSPTYSQVPTRDQVRSPDASPGSDPLGGQRINGTGNRAPPAGGSGGQYHNAPPQKGTKERKTKAQKVMAKLFEEAMGLTEAIDLIDVLYDALPKEVRKKTPKTGVVSKTGFNPGMKYVSPWDKAKAVFTHFGELDLPKAMAGVVANHFSDKAWGHLFRMQSKGWSNLGLKPEHRGPIGWASATRGL